eukprot:SAG22_NODE_682_length_7924_cov_25.432460_11_plen_204_part_00
MADILTEERKQTLDNMYYNKGITLGRDSLFQIVKRVRAMEAEEMDASPADPRLEAKYPSRRAIAEYLRNQELQQLYQGQRKPNVVRGIPPVRPGQSLSVDLIDFSKSNHGTGDMWYILTVLCNFSRFLMARPVFRKEPRFTAAKMREILTEARQVFGTAPRWVLCDAGTEFNADFITMLEQQPDGGIAKKRTLPGQPSSNGLV